MILRGLDIANASGDLNPGPEYLSDKRNLGRAMWNLSLAEISALIVGSLMGVQS